MPKLASTLEQKNFHFELKAIDEEQGIVEGYLSTFDNVDSQNDKVIKGAFKKTILEAKSRMQNKGKKYLWPVLWMHDPEKPLGGCFDAYEDSHGLYTKMQLDISTSVQGIPNNHQAVLAFSGYKQGYVSEQSMGYEAIQKDYEGKVRILKEVRIWEESCVVSLFAANDQAVSTGVKTMTETKTIVGNTAGPIGPRDESWDASAAQKQIWAYATKDDDTLDASKLKKCFMVLDGDAQLKGSWSYPYVYIKNGSPMICVGAVIAVVAAIGGARGASAPEGLKPKCEKLYSRINRKYPDDPELIPPWKDDGKSMSTQRQKKDFNDLYQDAQAADAYEDWCDLINALTGAMTQAFTIGDSPVSDMSDALDQFKEAAMAWAAEAQEDGLSDYLSDRYGPSSSGPYVPYSMRIGSEYSTRASRPDHKSGATFSQASRDAIGEQADQLNGMADQHKAMIKMHQGMATKAKQVAADLTSLWSGEDQGPAYAGDKDDGKSMRRGPSQQTPTRTGSSDGSQPGAPTDAEADTLSVLDGLLQGFSARS